MSTACISSRSSRPRSVETRRSVGPPRAWPGQGDVEPVVRALREHLHLGAFGPRTAFGVEGRVAGEELAGSRLLDVEELEAHAGRHL